MNLIQHQNIPINTRGTDWFVGDIHGAWGTLIDLLDDRGFDYSHDRCFACGDLIDRGPDSLGALKLLETEWFFSVLGNHELMLIAGLTDRSVRKKHIQMGGEWICELALSHLARIGRMLQDCMPVSMTIETETAQIGLIHAQAPLNWKDLQITDLTTQEILTSCWGFSHHHLATQSRGPAIHNIDLVISGHVGCNQIDTGPNQIWIDTFSHGQGLTLLKAEEALSLIKQSRPA